MFKPNKIILHHSKTPDDQMLQDWDAIRRYHMSWRYKFDIVTEDEAKKLVAAGENVTAPWRDIGYHAGLEVVKGKVVIQAGRPYTQMGAHCLGHNEDSLGICFVGDYDMEEPTPVMLYEGASLIMHLCQELGIRYSEIYGHRHFANDRTCPGTMFSVERLKYIVQSMAPR